MAEMLNTVPQTSTKAQDFKSVYSNNVQFTISPWDVVFMFGENQGVKDNQILLVEQTVRVVMSPQHAKVFSQVLRDQINKFEEAFGTINIPTNPQAQPDAQAKKPS